MRWFPVISDLYFLPSKILLILVPLISICEMISNNTYFKQIEPELRKPLSNHIFNRDLKKNTNEPQPFFSINLESKVQSFRIYAKLHCGMMRTKWFDKTLEKAGFSQIWPWERGYFDSKIVLSFRGGFFTYTFQFSRKNISI